jgi:hypothetical protein
LLGPVVTIGIGEISGDISEQGSIRVLAEVFEGVIGRADGLSQGDAVAAEEIAPLGIELLYDQTGVERIVIELVGLDHLDVVELDKESEEGDDQADPHVADLPVH